MRERPTIITQSRPHRRSPDAAAEAASFSRALRPNLPIPPQGGWRDVGPKSRGMLGNLRRGRPAKVSAQLLARPTIDGQSCFEKRSSKNHTFSTTYAVPCGRTSLS